MNSALRKMDPEFMDPWRKENLWDLRCPWLYRDTEWIMSEGASCDSNLLRDIKEVRALLSTIVVISRSKSLHRYESSRE